MKIQLFFNENPYFWEKVGGIVEWPCNIIPRHGDLISAETLAEIINWNSGDFTYNNLVEIACKYDFKRNFIFRYNAAIERHPHDIKDALKYMMEFVLEEINHVEKVCWVTIDKQIVPQIWLSKNKPVLDKFE